MLDYRYRIEFLKSKVPIFEMSLDQVRSKNLSNGHTTASYEAELEIAKSGFNEKDVKDLFRLLLEHQRAYKLKPSTKTKGGIEVPEI